MSKQPEPTTPTGRVDKGSLKRSKDDIGLTPTTSEKQRYGKESTSPHGKRRGRPPVAPTVEEFFNTSPVATSSPNVRARGPAKKVGTGS